MHYVALLRGINVGGNRKVEMSRLKRMFESVGYEQVQTYINSGNVVFKSKGKSEKLKIDEILRQAQGDIEQAIEKEFGFGVSTLVLSAEHLARIVTHLPEDWTNDEEWKTDVCCLWPDVDSSDILSRVGYNPEIETMIYTPGALIWHVSRANQGKSKFLKIVGTKLYRSMTIRNVNTVRKLATLVA